MPMYALTAEIIMEHCVKILEILEITRLECVQQASQQISLTAFARWGHC